MRAGPSRLPRAQSYLSSLSLICLLATGCDIPTQGPDFGFAPSASAPIVFQKSFVFLGPDGSGTEALIDTTAAAFDSVFSVDPTDNGVYVVRDLDAFDLMDIDDVLDPISLEPRDIAVTIGDMASQHFETSYEDRIGVVETVGGTTPALPSLVAGGSAYVPIVAGDVLTVPTTGVIDLSGADVDRVRVNNDPGPGVNEITFTLTNGLPVAVTDGSSTTGASPWVVLQTGSGSEIARSRFSRSPAPGQSAIALMSLAGIDIPADGRFALDVSTPQGFGPISADPTLLATSVSMTPVRYAGFDLSNIPATNAQAVRPGLSLDAEIDFTGVTTRDGFAMVRITNTLPLPVQIQSLTVTNTTPVASFGAGHRVVDRSGTSIGPKTAIDVPVFIGVNAVSRVVDVSVTATTPSTSASTSFDATDGLNVAVSGDVDVDVLYYHPAGESFSTESFFALSTTDVTFSDPTDYAEIGSGYLDIVDLLNGLDLTFEDVTISFPDILTAPYGPGDSLVVAFRGTTDKSNGREFAKIERNAPPRTVSVDLAGMRVRAAGNQVAYRVSARSETTSNVRAIAYDDRISARAGASDLVLAGISALADPFSATLTADVNGDGLLDPTTPGEGTTSRLSGYGALDDVTGLQLAGAELSINLTTTISGDLTLYGILAGEDDNGNVIYLRGQAGLAVSAADSMLQGFSVGGAPALPSQMFAVPVAIQGVSGQPTVETVVLDDANSNISDFVNALPTTIRFVGKALLGGGGGRLEVSQPATVDISVGIAVPLNVSGDFALTRTEPANLSSLSGLTDPDSDFSTESAALILSYSNGIPLGLRARLTFLDDLGSATVDLPAGAGESLDLQSAPTDVVGYAAGTSDGEVDFALSDADLLRLASSRDLRLEITFAPPSQSSGRIRATDRIDLSLRGDFRFNIHVGG